MCRTKTLICFWLSYVVFVSSVWKNLGMTSAGLVIKMSGAARKKNLFQGQLSALTLILVSVPPLSYRSST